MEAKWMVRMIMVLLLSLILGETVSAQAKPKLVVGIIVDQMRYEYLYRFQHQYGEGGFKRMMKDGFVYKNAHYNYIPTKTGPGHASVYTGTTPKNHGVILNSWYDRKLNDEINCVTDTSAKTVGSKSDNGEYSPIQLLTPTITDQLKISTQGRAKVISISLKNRGAILPAGHMADGAYWFDKETGDFISSTFYMDKLPKWVARFNKNKWPDKHLSQNWELIKPRDQYSVSDVDNPHYESVLPGLDDAAFPHQLSGFPADEKYDLFQTTPFGNSIVKEMVISALDSEELGQGNETDFLAISFSSTDKIGHAFGPQSLEIQDTYIRLDQDLSEILVKLDELVGAGNYTVFLTADHAVAENPDFLMSKKIGSGYYDESEINGELNNFLEEKFGLAQLVNHFADGQVYLDQAAISGGQLEFDLVTEASWQFLAKRSEVSDVLLARDLRRMDYTNPQRSMVQRGYHWHRSGDITVLYQPTFLEKREAGSSHGTGFSYDTHVPMLWFGQGVPQGHTYQYVSITSIASTVAYMLDIKVPDGNTGSPLIEILEED